MITDTVAYGNVSLQRHDDGTVTFTDKDGVTRTIADPNAGLLVDTIEALRLQSFPVTRVDF